MSSLFVGFYSVASLLLGLGCSSGSHSYSYNGLVFSKEEGIGLVAFAVGTGWL